MNTLCHCGRQKTKPGALMCNPCWALLPVPLRSAVLKTRDRHGKVADPASHGVAVRACMDHLNTKPKPQRA